jgi:hypothetical protein
MKTKIGYFLLMLVGVLACSEDFTETPAVGALSDQALQNAVGVDLLLTGAYSVLDGASNNGSGWTTSGDNWWFDAMSDDAHKGSTDGDQADLYLLEILDWTSGNPYLLGKWKALYAGENRANAVISLIGTIEEGDFSVQLAEARFLRGHYNFELQKIFGNVAYISDENYANVEFNQPNPGPIWDQIEADFDFAMSNLPSSQGTDVGRPNSWTAQAFLGKVHLFQSDWGQALSLLTGVINSGTYALLPEFVDNFRLAGDNSIESVFAIQFTADGGQSFNGNQGGTLNFGGPNGWCCGFYQPTQDLANAFQTYSGLPLLDTYNQTDVANDYGVTSSEAFSAHTGPLDPRIDYTLGRRTIQYNGWGEMIGKDWIRAGFADISGPYLPKKNVYYVGEDANMGTGGWGQQHSGINYHIMRYSDVLLMAAEAAVETGDMNTALDYVNQVRSRAKNMSYVQNLAETGDAANYQIELYSSFGSQDNARKAVRFERRIELGMEGHRLFDIRRWNNGTTTMNDYIDNESRTNPNIATKFIYDYEAKHNMCPIPLTAIDLSGGVLQQNPGY